jgi:hypothetical protein
MDSLLGWATILVVVLALKRIFSKKKPLSAKNQSNTEQPKPHKAVVIDSGTTTATDRPSMVATGQRGTVLGKKGRFSCEEYQDAGRCRTRVVPVDERGIEIAGRRSTIKDGTFAEVTSQLL